MAEGASVVLTDLPFGDDGAPAGREVQAVELGLRAKAIEFTATGSQIYHQADLGDSPVA